MSEIMSFLSNRTLTLGLTICANPKLGLIELTNSRLRMASDFSLILSISSLVNGTINPPDPERVMLK